MRANQNSLQYKVWIVCALGLFIDGYDLYISAIVEPFINVAFHPGSFMLGCIQASALLGSVFGAMLSGRVTDLIGRKSMLIFNLIFFVFISLLSACAWNSVSLCLFRFLVGFGVGADYPVCAAYLTEMMPAGKGTRSIASVMLINCLASPVCVLAAWLLYRWYPVTDVWRLMLASGALPALLALALRSTLPESLLWQLQVRSQLPEQKMMWKGYGKIFNKSYFKITFCTSMCWFLQDISYYGLGLFTPYVLASFGVTSDNQFISSALYMFKSTFIVNIFIMLGALTAICLLGKMKVITLQKIGFLSSLAGLLILYGSGFVAPNLFIPFIFSGFIIYNFFINLGPGVTTYLLPTQFYPVDIKATGHGFAAGMGKLGAFVGALSLPLLKDYIGMHNTVAVLAATLLLGYLLTRLLSDERVQSNELDSLVLAYE